jgi:5-methylcytosine-specific restriction endonuclease McrA
MSFDKKAYMLDYNRKYREANREKAKVYSAEYHAKNKELSNERCRNWYANRTTEAKQKRAEASKTWRLNNLEKTNGWRKLNYEKNKEAYKARAAAWSKLHPEAARQGCHRRRARKLNATIGNTKAIYHWETRWRQLEAARCYWCMETFSGKDCHCDHIVALSLGGAHEMSNLCIACESCNFSKNSKQLSVWNRTLNAPVLEF